MNYKELDLALAAAVEQNGVYAAQGAATRDFIASVDWALLKEQYEWLANETKSLAFVSSPTVKYAEGLLGVLESLKDLAVNHFGVDAVTVFGEEQE